MHKVISIVLLLVAFLFVYLYGEQKEKRLAKVENKPTNVVRETPNQSFNYSYDVPPTSPDSEEVKSCTISFGSFAEDLCILEQYLKANAYGATLIKRDNAIVRSQTSGILAQMPIKIYGFSNQVDANKYLENPDMTTINGLRFTNYGTIYDYGNNSDAAAAFVNIKSYRKVTESTGRLARVLTYELSKTDVSVVILAKQYLIVVDKTAKSYIDEYVGFADTIVSEI